MVLSFSTIKKYTPECKRQLKTATITQNMIFFYIYHINNFVDIYQITIYEQINYLDNAYIVDIGYHWQVLDRELPHVQLI